ncbi:hypothetical protein CGCF413_v003573 [Colletotrichum fructicola]|nr:hypothetical protein CGCF413_v003573 [Colletotrichum fructicola]
MLDTTTERTPTPTTPTPSLLPVWLHTRKKMLQCPQKGPQLSEATLHSFRPDLHSHHRLGLGIVPLII